ncbi:MAG: excinuclease ABC subunit UvrA, partial [Planctomycetota bacterium]
AIAPWNTPSYRHELEELLAIADHHDLPVDVPYSKLKKKHHDLIWNGDRKRRFGGLKGFFDWLDRKKYKMHVRVFASRYRTYFPCSDCGGKRFRPEALSYRLGSHSIADVLDASADQLTQLLESDEIPPLQRARAQEPLAQIQKRLQFLRDVGLGYLQLSRSSRTLSGGELQRVSLTTALGSTLVGMLYVLDEPTAGLHPHDVKGLVRSITELLDRGNTVVVVEHEETMIRQADSIVEFGPGAGEEGGSVLRHGSPEEVLADEDSITGQFLVGHRGVTLKNRERRQPRGQVKLKGASGNNLKGIDVEIPIGVMAVVTGVSGSGKSTLVQDTLYPAIARAKGESSMKPLPYKSISGVGTFQDVMLVDQSPISRSARSVPVTYVKAFDAIRKVFAAQPEAKIRNLQPGHFSFNSDRGACEQCEGSGRVEIDMQFLADITMTCPACNGKRFRDRVLEVRYRDHSIADVMAMSARQAIGFFADHDKVVDRLRRLTAVGLDYIKLGQAATTLSSGEGQRLKLAGFLAGSSKRRTLFIMDEPSTGLHFADIQRLIGCFDSLIDEGHSLLIVEHHPLLMTAADWIIDIGPGAAGDGGEVVATGTPEDLARQGEGLTSELFR